VAHEIGESVAHRVFAALCVGPEDAPENAREQVANHLASCLLLPRDWFAADGPAVEWDLIALKELYWTASHELIARRMLEMPPPIVVTLCDLGRVRWRRANTGSRPLRLLPEENNVWRVAHESGTAASATFDASATGLDSVTAISGAATSLANIGPGLGPIIGPAGNFQPLNDSAKWLLTAGMYVGRLELMVVFVLFLPRFWRTA